LLDPEDYATSQAFGARERRAGAEGIVYPSVRDEGGECVAVFRTRPLSPARQGIHLGYLWDGHSITDVIELRDSHINPH
jgi:hypothetical protein